MKTRVKVTYIAMDSDGHKPIVSAGTFEDLKRALDEEYNVKETEAECLGFTPYNTKYPDEYEGYYEYKFKINIKDFKTNEFIPTEITDKILVYSVDFYPHTIYKFGETLEDEDIRRQAEHTPQINTPDEKFGFITGAKWVREEVKKNGSGYADYIIP